MLNIPSHNFSYIIGFIQGDGHNEQSSTGHKGRISLEISERDIDILDKLELALEDIVKVSRSTRIRTTNFKDNSKSVILKIFNKSFRQELTKYVPVGKKSETVSAPINFENFSERDYIRGLIDSDGSLGLTSNNKPFISFCTKSEALKDFILANIKKIIGAEKQINRNTRDGIYNISLFNEDAVNYVKYLYAGSEIYLDRKYIKFEEMLSWVRKIPKRNCRPKTWLISEDEVVKRLDLSLNRKVEILNRSKLSIKMRAWRLSKQE
jgi:hypothetical protein